MGTSVRSVDGVSLSPLATKMNEPWRTNAKGCGWAMENRRTRYIAAYDTEAPDKRCLTGCKSIRAVHEAFDFPGTFFIVGFLGCRVSAIVGLIANSWQTPSYYDTLGLVRFNLLLITQAL